MAIATRFCARQRRAVERSPRSLDSDQGGEGASRGELFQGEWLRRLSDARRGADTPKQRGPDSTRSTSQVLHELAVDAAIANGRTDVIVSFDDGRIFGEVFRSGGTDYFQSSYLRVRFDVNTGDWFSNFWVDAADPNLPQLVLP